MYVTIQVMLLVEYMRVSKGGTFSLRNRLPEKVAYGWIQEIKREMNVQEILKVVSYGEDITDKVKNIS